MSSIPDSMNPVEHELIVRQLDISAFTDPETGAITDRDEALRWINEQAAGNYLPQVRDRLDRTLEDLDETHQGEYLHLLTMVCWGERDWQAVEAYATRAEVLHVRLGDPGRAANAAVHRAESFNGSQDHEAVLGELATARDYLDQVPEYPAGSEEQADTETVVAGTKKAYGEALRIALVGMLGEGKTQQVADYCRETLEKPAFAEEEAALLLVSADMQAEAKDYAEAMASMRRLESLSVEMGRFDIATNTALGQAACSLKEFEGISAPGDYRRASDYLRSYAEAPAHSPARLAAEAKNLTVIRDALAKRGLLQQGQLVIAKG